MPPSPPPTSSSTATAAGSHMRRGPRNEKSNRYSKNQSTANLATPRRPLRTPTSSPLAMSSGLNNFIPSRTRLVSQSFKSFVNEMQGDPAKKNLSKRPIYISHVPFVFQIYKFFFLLFSRQLISKQNHHSLRTQFSNEKKFK